MKAGGVWEGEGKGEVEGEGDGETDREGALGGERSLSIC